MTPQDLFISSRQLFGYVVPGVVWLCAFAMLFLTLPLHTLVTFAGDASIIEAIWFSGIATLVGIILGRSSFQFNRQTTKQAFIRIAATENREERVAAQASLQKLGRLPSGLPQTPELSYEQARALFIACKLIIQKEAAGLFPVLIEKEAEINLIAMLSPAVLVFAVVVACRAGELHQLGFRWSQASWQVWVIWRFGLVGLATWFAVVSRKHFLWSRIDEEKTTLRIYLNLYPAPSSTQSTPTHSKIA